MQNITTDIYNVSIKLYQNLNRKKIFILISIHLTYPDQMTSQMLGD